MNRADKYPLGEDLDEITKVQREVNDAFPTVEDGGELASQMDEAKMTGTNSREAGAIGVRDAEKIEEFRTQVAAVPDTGDEGELASQMEEVSTKTQLDEEEQTPSMSPLPSKPKKKGWKSWFKR